MTTRRTFIATASSLLLAPLLKVNPTIDRHELLMMFTDDICMRWDLSKPYVFNKYAYATDGRAMARITSSDVEHSDDSVRVPPLESTWAKYFKQDSRWRKFELMAIEDLTPPKDKYGGSCPLCDDKWIDCPKSHELDTWDCDDPDCDEGLIPNRNCELCHGTSYHGGCYQPVGDVLMGYQFAKKLAKVPGCEVTIAEPSAFPSCRGSDYVMLRPILFRSDLISGIIAPIDPEA